MLCRRFLVRGQVQGVFFRATTREIAHRLGLSGWVRNLTDGGVELVACGDDASLKELEAWLWKGPPHARVAQVVASEAEPRQYSGFEIAF